MDSDPPGPAEKISDPKWPVKTAIFDYVILNHRYKSEESGPTFLLLAAIFALVSVFMLSGTVRWLLIIFHIRILILLAFTPDPQSKYFFTLCTLLPVSVMLLFRKYFLNRNLIKPQ
jgi:D-alanyl-lipoteichoic acid acyltransferase DltB (MBOAT superfamily)